MEGININHLARVLALNAEVEALKTKREAMIVSNTYHNLKEETIVHTEESFIELSQKIWKIAKELQYCWRI